METAIVIKVEVSARPIFTCRNCGVRAAGDVVRIEANDMETAQRRLRECVKAHAMPVGWASCFPYPSFECSAHDR